MKDTPINYEVVSRHIRESRIRSIGRASIREIKRLINGIENGNRGAITFEWRWAFPGSHLQRSAFRPRSKP